MASSHPYNRIIISHPAIDYRLFISLLSLLLLLLLGCSREKPKSEIVIGLNPSERSENVQRNAEVLARMIGERAGMPVRIFVAQDYSGLVEALRGRTIDFAFFAPVSYVFAERIADARVLLKAERKGKPYYYGCVVVNADSSYRTLADLKGKNIAWVDPTSASGHIFPKAALIEAGIDPDAYFGRQTFAGGHDAVLLSVINGTITAGATFANDTLGESGSWTQLSNGDFARKVRPIFYSRPIPGDNLATTQYMIDNYPEIVAKVRDGVQRITDDSAGREMMKAMYHVDAMVPATSADYDPVRDAARLLELDITGKIGAEKEGSLARDSARDAERRRNTTISLIALAIAATAGIGFLVYQTIRERRRRRAGSVSMPAAGKGASDDRSRSDDAAAAVNASDQAASQFSIHDLTVTYRDNEGGAFTALKNLSLEIPRGQFIAVIGLSGAGKSTLLRSLNRMNEPSSGAIHFEGKDITHLQGKELAALRRRIGFIFQQFNLVKNLSVLTNVLSGRLGYISGLDSMLGRFPKRDRDIALRYIDEVGLADKRNNRADKLSGGQQQRVALAQQPAVILADEPMASLDPKLAEVVLQILRRFNRVEGITVIVNLHVLDLARTYADRIVALRRGEIAFDGTPEELSAEVVEEIYRVEEERQ